MHLVAESSMSFRPLFPLFGAFLAVWSICDGAHGGMKLELVQVIFRHAKRTPLADEADYINIHVPTIYEPPDFYKLTNDGKKQSYEFGCLLRREYGQFLGLYDATKIHALSSNFDCPKMSLQLVLAGLYPPSSGAEKWHPSINWSPTPVYYNNGKVDLLFIPGVLENYVKIYDEEIRKSKDYWEFIHGYSNFIRYVEDNTGVSLSTNLLRKTSRFHTITQIHSMMNLPLPPWYTNDTAAKFEELFKFALRATNFTRKLQRSSGGLLIKKTIDNAKNADGATKKLYLYACHDVTISAFTGAQNITAFEIPPYASSIIMEKYSDSEGRAYVRARSGNGSNGDFVTLRIANCNEFCPMEEYLRIVEDVIPSDEELKYLAADQ